MTYDISEQKHFSMDSYIVNFYFIVNYKKIQIFDLYKENIRWLVNYQQFVKNLSHPF